MLFDSIPGEDLNSMRKTYLRMIWYTVCYFASDPQLKSKLGKIPYKDSIDQLVLSLESVLLIKWLYIYIYS